MPAHSYARLPRAGQHPPAPAPGRPPLEVAAVDVTLADADPARPGNSAAAVLRAVLDHGPVARAAIGQATGLSPAAVSRQAADLISLGLLRELPDARQAAGRAGRPHIPVDVDTARHLACGVHIAVPMLTFGLVDLRGHVVAQEQVEHDGDPARVLALLGRHLPDFLRRHHGLPRAGRIARDRTALAPAGRLLGVGVVSGGLVDTRGGTILEHAPLGWRDVPVAAPLTAATGLPVHVDSHARALAQAEILFGDPRARRGLVHLFAGHVVDAAIAMDGTVLRGQRSAAGGVAHLRIPGGTQRCACGGTGCAEATLSERAWLARATAEGVVARPDIRLLADAVARRQPLAVALVRERLRLVGRLVALLIDMIDPEVVVLTEMATLQLPELIADVHAEVAARSRSCGAPGQVVRPSSFGPDVLAVAAAASILGAVHRSPRSVRPSLTQIPADALADAIPGTRTKAGPRPEALAGRR
ncbi:ROK family transcriptional regulator [Frankia sp. CNm7]|uniref:ROK family transcriptional regulator n=1 Tax=Frankia nepalensis TaxID=1836974 RepID=A0A937RFU1_9ACTN|nr:ROK family transcriptional regulator [Frankia nepalensis]MBL7501185.1 ROK family transcriptional regulator [Frankia nepalensis]MBL7515733.1 ROK family transcriptional regulator [Frankia nepalensis]MBL7521801.1 ROK family transcriptional regulator [Frankia nepalensis]MBL7631401.1 ROK family transcriptional regulator [Frankia nepalensis]